MKLRDSLKIIAIIMFVETIIASFKTLFFNNFDFLHEHFGQAASVVSVYYLDFAIWVQLLLYLVFAWHIVWVGSRIPNSRFGSYFLLDSGVAILNASLVTATFHFNSYMVGFWFKLSVEALAILTCFWAGHKLYKDLHSNAVRKICFSFWLLSLRHFNYCIILIATLFMYGPSGISEEALSNKGTINVAWWLVTPVLIYSRWLLMKGTNELKITAEEKEKKRELKVV